MPIRHAIWKVAAQPTPLVETSLATEQLLEEMIVANNPSLFLTLLCAIPVAHRAGTFQAAVSLRLSETSVVDRPAAGQTWRLLPWPR